MRLDKLTIKAQEALSAALEAALAPLGTVRGLGAYRVIDAGERAHTIATGLEDRGVRVRRFPNGRIAVIPALDQLDVAASALAAAVKDL